MQLSELCNEFCSRKGIVSRDGGGEGITWTNIIFLDHIFTRQDTW